MNLPVSEGQIKKWRPDNWRNPIGTFIQPYGDGQRWAFEQGADAMLKEVAKEIFTWLQSHCKGYHRGNHDGEFGHFGIYRSEIDEMKSKLGIKE